MGDDKDQGSGRKDSSLLKLVGIPVLIALLAGGSAPWWVDLIRSSDQGTAEEGATDPVLGGTTDAATSLVNLVTPRNGSTVVQTYQQPLRFSWDEPSNPTGIVEYQIRVFAQSASVPLVDTTTSQLSWTHNRECSYVIDRNRTGWTWSVRAHYDDGTWGDWSETSTFDFSPFDRTMFCNRCPSVSSCQ